jgi:hypothetical protein
MPWGAVVSAVAPSVIGGIGSMFGGNKAAKQSMSGFNYLTGNKGVQGTVDAGNAATSNAGQLLGTQPLTPGASNGFTNYLNSTGYNFQKDQGMSAITGSAAARGTLNSGSTDKALEQYGQGLSGTYFNNYLNQLGSQSSRGLTAAGDIGQAGTTGGGNAGNQQQSGTSAAFGQFGSAAASGLGAYQNYFGGQGAGANLGGAYMGPGGNYVPGAQGFQ